MDFEIAELVDSIPEDGFFNMSSRDTFFNVATTLFEAGFELGDIHSMLTDLYVAVEIEFN